jgi:ERCC4-type nuclease
MTSPAFTIIIDSREQRPFDFSRWGVGTIRGTLKSGDYGLVDNPNVAVERKSPEDLLSTLSHGRDRFEAELARLQPLEFSAVVCEGPIDLLLAGTLSKMSPPSVMGSILALQQRFPGTHWWFCNGRRFAARLTLKILERFHRDTIEGKRPARGVAA